MDAGFSLVGSFRYGRSVMSLAVVQIGRVNWIRKVHAGARRSRLPSPLASPYPKPPCAATCADTRPEAVETASSRKPDFPWFYPLFPVPRPRLRRL